MRLPRAFRPGLYTLTLYPSATFPATVEQDFAWGVLAVNPDKDRYLAGETAEFAFGVLDEYGRIVCDADLSLVVRSPDGSLTVLSTANGGIVVTGTCGQIQPGSISPDYRASLPLPLKGVYSYDVFATTANGTWTVSGTIPVLADPPVIIARAAATRLWPRAASPMTITVSFFEDFRGTITDVVPLGFTILTTEPEARVSVRNDEERTIQWHGSWKAGETAQFRFKYDAPDISPEFFLVGPLELGGRGQMLTMVEYRQWQIANDEYCGDYICDPGEEYWCYDDCMSSSSSSEPTGACCMYDSCYDGYTSATCYGTFYQDLS
ncbi:MAG: hypothetical protein WC353_06880, partial [Candidatus Peribacter sp.]